jgi:hypothetical protein
LIGVTAEFINDYLTRHTEEDNIACGADHAQEDSGKPALLISVSKIAASIKLV